MTNRNPASTPVGVVLTEQIVQSSTPDAHGDFALTGTVRVQGSSSFTQGTLQPESFASGNLGRQTVLMNDGSILSATLTVSVPISQTKPSLLLYPVL